MNVAHRKRRLLEELAEVEVSPTSLRALADRAEMFSDRIMTDKERTAWKSLRAAEAARDGRSVARAATDVALADEPATDVAALGEVLPPVSVEGFTTKRVLEEIEHRIMLVLRHVDPVSLSKANARELASVLNILVQNRQLLKGEPTQIVSAEDRRQIKDMIPALMAEAKRRGLT